MTDISKPNALLAATAFAAFMFTIGPARAIGTDDPAPAKPAAAPADKKDTKASDTKPADAKSDEKKATEPKEKSDKKSERQFRDGYRHAYDLIYRQHDYAAAIVALHALGQDAHPDVANLIGFASRKLGDYEAAKVWYEKALVSDPGHTRTWQYYGLWHLEQGNRLKAEEHLERIRLICGTDCNDFLSLKKALESKITY